MESLHTVTKGRPGSAAGSRVIRGLAALSAGCLLLCSGCLTLDSTFHKDERPPHGDVAMVVATWDPQIAYAEDPTKQGAYNPGLHGRVFLSGPDWGKACYAADGDIIAYIYDDTIPTPPGTTQQWLEGTRFDKTTLQRLAHKDPMGWGYSLWMPWFTYRPGITRIHVKIEYQRSKGLPLFQECPTMTLNPVQDMRYSSTTALAPGTRVPTGQSIAAGQPTAPQATGPTSVSINNLTGQGGAPVGVNSLPQQMPSVQAYQQQNPASGLVQPGAFAQNQGGIVQPGYPGPAPSAIPQGYYQNRGPATLPQQGAFPGTMQPTAPQNATAPGGYSGPAFVVGTTPMTPPGQAPGFAPPQGFQPPPMPQATAPQSSQGPLFYVPPQTAPAGGYPGDATTPGQGQVNPGYGNTPVQTPTYPVNNGAPGQAGPYRVIPGGGPN